MQQSKTAYEAREDNIEQLSGGTSVLTPFVSWRISLLRLRDADRPVLLRHAPALVAGLGLSAGVGFQQLSLRRLSFPPVPPSSHLHVRPRNNVTGKVQVGDSGNSDNHCNREQDIDPVALALAFGTVEEVEIVRALGGAGVGTGVEVVVVFGGVNWQWLPRDIEALSRWLGGP